jgi:cystathionine gamma-synthase/cystathionine beta-lyase
MKTLSIRLDRQQENAAKIALWLRGHPSVQKVYYPGLAGHPGHEMMNRQGKGFGAMIAFEVADPAMVAPLLSRVELISFAESLGGVETLITFPALQTHADIEPETRQRLGITSVLLRLSVGIEDADDLITDLERALTAEVVA